MCHEIFNLLIVNTSNLSIDLFPMYSHFLTFLEKLQFKILYGNEFLC